MKAYTLRDQVTGTFLQKVLDNRMFRGGDLKRAMLFDTTQELLVLVSKVKGFTIFNWSLVVVTIEEEVLLTRTSWAELA